MELTVLGASGTWPSGGAATSGYLVRHEGFNLYVDAGTGTLANLQRHIRIADIHGILISHEHPDHFVDLYPTFYARHYGSLGTPGLPLYAPIGFATKLEGLLSEDGRAAMRLAFTCHELEPGEGFELGPFRVRTEPMEHLGLPALGFRLETGGAALAYTGDTGPTAAIETLAAGADLLLAEATWQDGDELLPFHLSARQAGEHAARAGVGRLVLTHIWPTADRDRSREQAGEAFGGPVEVAVEGLRLEVHA